MEEKRFRWAGRPSKPVGAARRPRVGSTPALFRHSAAGVGRTRREQMKLRSALLAATVVAMPFAASAQPVTGLYVGAGAGVNLTQQESIKNLASSFLNPLGAGIATSGDLKRSVGFAGVVSVGWGFGNGLRAEIEGNYRNNRPNGVT